MMKRQMALRTRQVGGRRGVLSASETKSGAIRKYEQMEDMFE